MLTKLGINYKRYFLITGITTLVLTAFISTNITDVVSIWVVYFAAFINQLMLVKFCREFFTEQVATKRNNIDKAEVASLFIVKVVVLVAGISFGVLFMGTRVIFPLLNYVIQMFVLAFCLKQDALSSTNRKDDGRYV